MQIRPQTRPTFRRGPYATAQPPHYAAHHHRRNPLGIASSKSQTSLRTAARSWFRPRSAREHGTLIASCEDRTELQPNACSRAAGKHTRSFVHAQPSDWISRTPGPGLSEPTRSGPVHGRNNADGRTDASTVTFVGPGPFTCAWFRRCMG